jgi:hypothetical protein
MDSIGCIALRREAFETLPVCPDTSPLPATAVVLWLCRELVRGFTTALLQWWCIRRGVSEDGGCGPRSIEAITLSLRAVIPH